LSEYFSRGLGRGEANIKWGREGSSSPGGRKEPTPYLRENEIRINENERTSETGGDNQRQRSNPKEHNGTTINENERTSETGT
jgi:hypothetical protein